MVSVRYFFTRPILAMPLAERVWITWRGAMRLSVSIFLRMDSTSGPASSRIWAVEVK